MSGFTARLSRALVEKKLVTQEQLTLMSREAGTGGKNLARLLIDRGLLTEDKLFDVLAEDLGMPVISLSKYHIDPMVANLIPERLARQYAVIPISKFGERLV